MGEEQKKPEKKEEAAEEKKPDEPQDIVLKVDMHCQGCAKKVKKSLLKFEGVENVTADSRSKTVVVKSKTADPAKVFERVQRKTKRRVELVSPLLPPPPEEEKKEENPPPPPEEENKEEPPKAITVILKVQMHCGACAKLLEQRISKIEGVELVVTDLPNDQVTVKGVMDQAVLVDIVQRKMRRTAVIVEGEEEKQEDEKKPDQDEKKVDETKADDGHANEHKYEFWPPSWYYVDYVHHFPLAPAPLIDDFSEENPNACAIV
ncbi:heavy metal-associated isoprenylated plant protein 7 [Lolium perenne]|uniref:heavy metal-associated isoprenylated plant protein 7 n=1 Tax=Lolium perenne TaxID=4522 RepID=UPI0021F54DE2|nr:heavy metal-associated isoprenylated plant protein 7-like [Lolium perenne]